MLCSDVETALQPPGTEDAAEGDFESAANVQVLDFVAVWVKCAGKKNKGQLHVAKVGFILLLPLL